MIGLLTATKIKNAVNSCIVKGVVLPDLMSYLSDPKKSEKTKETLNNLQILIIHNNMDVAAVDGLRRFV